ncbi:DUF192 domain-containing protein [Microbacterium sp. NPDC096154]|uniref:DUF192 domain-containing protein n=1 Tax=Microbacterium sp. NPDC096154 TaxID=3155549 RepID=UPI0033189E72
MERRMLIVDSRETAPLLVTTSFADRLRGMLLRTPLPPALLIRPCTSVHGAFMRSALDVAFLDAEGRVLRTVRLHPWRVAGPMPGARSVLEAPPGSFAAWGLGPGSRVRHV